MNGISKKLDAMARKHDLYIDVFDESPFSDVGYKTIPNTVEILFEIIAETSKALYGKVVTGNLVGKSDGYRTWIPKSVILGERI